jgi:Sigma-70 region 2
MTHRLKPVSYEALYAAHHGEVLRLCNLLLANHHDAEEIAQEVFLKVYQQLQNMKQTETMMWRPWLMRSASTHVVIGDALDGGNCGVGPMKNTRKRIIQILAALLKKWFSAEKRRGVFGARLRNCLRASGRSLFFTM